jgi:hypothetical protein
MRLSGVTVDITDRKGTEEPQNLLAREADHRAKNALARRAVDRTPDQSRHRQGLRRCHRERIGALARRTRCSPNALVAKLGG